MSPPAPGHVSALGALTALFAARVLGQALVALLDFPLLPPMSAWYSGLLPYPILLRVAACTSSRCGWQAECNVPSAEFNESEKPKMKGQLLCTCSS